MTAELPHRDELIFLFTVYLSKFFPGIDPIDVFNAIQSQIRGVPEKFGYLTISGAFHAELKDFESAAFTSPLHPKGVLVVNNLQHADVYKDIYGIVDSCQMNEGVDYVYLMLDKRNKYIKIGRSINPRLREKTLQSEEPAVELIAFWKAPGAVEKELHRMFAVKRDQEAHGTIRKLTAVIPGNFCSVPPGVDRYKSQKPRQY